jgi:pimeloyl-ACP methyl ester carboxylesterase
MPATPYAQSSNSPDRSPIESKRKLVKHGVMCVEVIINGTGSPSVVLIPSWGRDSEEFDELASLVAGAGLRVLRPVPRGAGATDGLVDGVSVYDLAGDIVAVLEQEANGAAIVAGHAFGSYVARAVSAMRPDLVCGVALIAAGQRAPAASHLVEAVLKSADMGLSIDERMTYLSRVFFAPGNDASVWLTGWNPKIGVASASAFKTPHSDYWQAGHAPVLDLIALEDPLRPPATRNDIQDDLGTARVTIVLIPNASHAVVIEQTQRVAEELIKFARANATA